MIETDRLRLRPWTDAELPLLARWNTDPLVTLHFGRPRTAEETAERFARMQAWEAELGFTFWAVERKADGVLVGNCGLKPLTVPWPEPGDIEIGWLLAPEAWGRGDAAEAARAALAFGLDRAPRVIAMIGTGNAPSIQVARAIGLERTPELDFDHPEIAEGPFRRHIVFARAR